MNLDGVKSVTRALLYVDPEPAPLGFVHHPFFQNEFVYDGELFNLFEDVDRARRLYDGLIDGACGAGELLVLIRDPYKMLWFSLASDFLGEEFDCRCGDVGVVAEGEVGCEGEAAPQVLAHARDAFADDGRDAVGRDAKPLRQEAPEARDGI